MGRLCPDLAITFYQGDWMKFYPLQLHGSEPQLEPRMTHAAYKTSLPIGRPTTGVGPSPFHGGRGATSLPRRSNWSAPDNMPDISTGQSWPGGSSGDPNGSWPSNRRGSGWSHGGFSHPSGGPSGDPRHRGGHGWGDPATGPPPPPSGSYHGGGGSGGGGSGDGGGGGGGSPSPLTPPRVMKLIQGAQGIPGGHKTGHPDHHKGLLEAADRQSLWWTQTGMPE